MEYRILGKTGLRVSAVGFGGIPIQRITSAEARPLMECVHAAGINFIDTAKMYTVSEALLGEVLVGMRQDFVLASKSMARTREAMAADIDDSLCKLRTTYIDLYQIHNPSLLQLEEVLAPGGAMEALREAKAAGKIGHIGLTAHALEVFARALEIDEIETVMFPYNIVETQGEDLIAECAKRNVGFIAMKPLAGGAIEDGRLAIRFIADNPAVTVVIPGMHCSDEVRENCAAAADRSPWTEKERTAMEEVRRQLGENFCRRCNYCAPCTVGIRIPNVFLFAGYLERYNLADWAKERYATLDVKASACIDCGQCEERCPYHLPIRDMLRRAAFEFGE